MNHTLDYIAGIHQEQKLLKEVEVPIVTVSATFRQHLEEQFGEDFPDGHEVVFSRAHYSMAVGLLIEAFEQQKTAWMADPTNYVSEKEWNKVLFTEFVGQQMARYKPLKDLKDRIDTQARNKLPISDAIDDPLLELTEGIERPILSLHYETGRYLAQAGHRVVQVITDPHVRPQYLDLLPDDGSDTTKQILYCVFDNPTKDEFFKMAKKLGKSYSEEQVVVTGPPVDPRIVAAREDKEPLNLSRRPLRLAITTGGLGTNRSEIQKFLHQLRREMFYSETDVPQLQLFLYAGTHPDFLHMYQEFARLNDIEVGTMADEEAPVRILYEDDIVEANELLLEYMFPWADGIITKPSGDMAYDAVAAGCFTLFLEPWGEWEENIQKRFMQLGTSLRLDVNHVVDQLSKFTNHYWDGDTWFVHAKRAAMSVPKQYLNGSKEIVKAFSRFSG